MGLIVRAPSPLAPGIKLVRRECVPSLRLRDSLLRAADGDIGSFSRLCFLLLGVRLNVGGAGIRVTLSVLDGGPMADIVSEFVGGWRFVGDARFMGR